VILLTINLKCYKLTKKNEEGKVMIRKTSFFSLFCFLFLFSGIVGAQDTISLPIVMSSTNSLVGTWNLANCTGSCSEVPNQFVFNANGTGTASGPGGGTFTWTLCGNQLILNPTSGDTNVANINWIDNNNFIATLVAGGNKNQTTWKRA
jgi:hypothetical protein